MKDNFEYFDYLGYLGHILQNNNQWARVYGEQMKFIEMLQTSYDVVQPISNIINQNSFLAESVIPKQLDMLGLGENIYLRKAFEGEMQLITASVLTSITPELLGLQNYIQAGNIMAGMNKFVSDIQSSHYTPAANIAFLCNTSSVSASFIENGLPRGTKSFLRKIHKTTSNKLRYVSDIEVSCEKKVFKASDSDSEINAIGMNLIVSSIDLLAELEENELMKFVDVLSDRTEMAMLHPVGKRIYEIISKCDSFVGFEQDCYYHGRPMKENGMKYTSDEMGKAPNNCVATGRYNHMRQSHYYFSDTPKGAISEVNKHYHNKEVQIAKLKPKRSIKMIDLSETVTTKNVFLESLRFELSDDKLRKEYLLPCFVASCCKDVGIEGIKYLGTKEYNNFVCWEDGYFEIAI